MFISNSFDDAEGYWDLCVNWQFNFSHKKKKTLYTVISLTWYETYTESSPLKLQFITDSLFQRIETNCKLVININQVEDYCLKTQRELYKRMYSYTVEFT